MCVEVINKCFGGAVTNNNAVNTCQKKHINQAVEWNPENIDTFRYSWHQ